jgi:hypothetical protein
MRLCGHTAVREDVSVGAWLDVVVGNGSFLSLCCVVKDSAAVRQLDLRTMGRRQSEVPSQPIIFLAHDRRVTNARKPRSHCIGELKIFEHEK